MVDEAKAKAAVDKLKRGSAVGSQFPTRMCSGCKKGRSIGGGRIVNKLFYCRECK